MVPNVWVELIYFIYTTCRLILELRLFVISLITICPNYKYLLPGAAHGLCAIVQILLCFPSCFEGKSEIETDLKNATDFILRCKQDNGNYPVTVSNDQDTGDELVHWCHGAPGVVYLMVKAYLRWRDEKYLKAAFQCGDVVWEKGLLTKGPGICHGVGGKI